MHSATRRSPTPCPRIAGRTAVVRIDAQLVGQRNQEGVPLGVNLPAASFLERGAKEPLVLRQGFRVPAIADALEERGGLLDVREEKCDRPGRQASHAPPRRWNLE